MKLNHNMSRRKFLTATALLGGGALLPKPFAFAQAQRVRVGMMLPYTGTYAQLGTAITNGFKLAVAERGGKLGHLLLHTLMLRVAGVLVGQHRRVDIEPGQ